MVEHVLADRPGDWKITIIGSQANDRWEMKIMGPNAFERSYTLEGTSGQHDPFVIGEIVSRMVPRRLKIMPRVQKLTNLQKMLISTAIDAAKNCIHVFEAEYPGDERPRSALEAAEKWLEEPTYDKQRALEALERQVWRSKGLEWPGARCRGGLRMCRASCSSPSLVRNGRDHFLL